jgi:hypothetical protein
MTSRPYLELRSFLKLIILFALAVTILAYVAFQARFLIIGPVVRLTTETKPVYNERTIEISGQAENITDLTLNGRPIFTNEGGVFSEKLVLENGYTIMTIRAHDRYGRETTLTRSFVYRPASSINI